MRNLVCLVALFLGTALGANAAFAAGGGAGTRTDPCALVTPDEVADAFGEPPGPPQNDGIGGCNYMGSKSGWETQAAISVDENPGRADFFDAQASQGDRLTIDDLGDRAFAFDSPGGFTQVTVLKDETLLTVTISAASLEDRVGATTELARAAAERLGTEAALARIPGLEALAGRWFADAAGPASATTDRREWIIEPDGHWVMTLAPEYSGYIATQDGAWRVESQQASLSGDYDIDDEDSFETSGDIEAAWSRIPEGDMPKGIDPIFFGIWSSVPLSGNAPVGPLDPALVGYWQADGDPDIEERLVWRISDSGYAVLTAVSRLEGEITVEEGRFALEPEAGDGVRGTYRLMGPDAFETTDNHGTIRWQRRGTGIVP
ncbi:MAG: hypothetical protein AB7V53_07825 [Dongiaceae bacterium]